MDAGDEKNQEQPLGEGPRDQFLFEEGRIVMADPLPPARSKKSFFRRHPVWTGLGCILLLGVLIRILGAASALLPRQDCFGVLHVDGFMSSPEKVVDWARALQKDKAVKGVLLAVNSPGGAVVPAMEMYEAVRELNGHKPVVAYMSTVAASGGYLVALGARRIVANPATITGSIGVKMEIPNVLGLMHKIGVSQTSLASGVFKDAGSPFQPLSEEARAYLLGVVDDMFAQFREIVRERRKLTPEEVAAVSDGRVFTGRQALAVRLVDATGSRRDALASLSAMTGLSADAPLLEGPTEEKEGILRRLVFSWLGLPPPGTYRSPGFFYAF